MMILRGQRDFGTKSNKRLLTTKTKDMYERFVFIYAKNGKIKALDFEQATNIGKSLINDGWKHTSTLDSCVYIEYIHNECKEFNEIKRLSKF